MSGLCFIPMENSRERPSRFAEPSYYGWHTSPFCHYTNTAPALSAFPLSTASFGVRTPSLVTHLPCSPQDFCSLLCPNKNSPSHPTKSKVLSWNGGSRASPCLRPIQAPPSRAHLLLELLRGLTLNAVATNAAFER